MCYTNNITTSGGSNQYLLIDAASKFTLAVYQRYKRIGTEDYAFICMGKISMHCVTY